MLAQRGEARDSAPARVPLRRSHPLRLPMCRPCLAFAHCPPPLCYLPLSLCSQPPSCFLPSLPPRRALEAATVPDCSHSGLCTECGVCEEGAGFGQNVVFEPPPIPPFEGHYSPNSTKAQRLRFRCGRAFGWAGGQVAVRAGGRAGGPVHGLP